MRPKARLSLTRPQARALQLTVQGLESERSEPVTEATVLDTIRTMGLLQIDTIHVVARSPYLVLWSRLGDYESALLDQLLATGKIFETWSHVACFAPIEAYPVHAGRRFEQTPWRRRIGEYAANHRADADRLLAGIAENGPVKSSDFERVEGKASGWWDWKPEKMLLEVLWLNGELMVARRDRFQRLYDLPANVHRGFAEAPLLLPHESHPLMAIDAVRALGVTTPGWVHDYYRLPKTGLNGYLQAGVDAGELVPAEIEGLGEALIHSANVSLAEAAAADRLIPTRTTVLSPFDPIVWHRERAEQLFDFSYLIECYTPAHKRVYGYFTLPLLHRGQLIGRIDAKAHRKAREFEVIALHFEPGFTFTDQSLDEVAEALLRLAKWHDTPQVVVTRTEPRKYRAALSKILRKRT